MPSTKNADAGTRNKSGGPRSNPTPSFVADLNRKRRGPWLGFRSSSLRSKAN